MVLRLMAEAGPGNVAVQGCTGLRCGAGLSTWPLPLAETPVASSFSRDNGLCDSGAPLLPEAGADQPHSGWPLGEVFPGMACQYRRFTIYVPGCFLGKWCHLDGGGGWWEKRAVEAGRIAAATNSLRMYILLKELL